MNLRDKVLANFSAGPAFMPDAVNARLADLFKQRGQNGSSILELSHRSPRFDELRYSLNVAIQRILNIPDNYSILLLPGGGRGQYAAVPMNLSLNQKAPVYASTGYWSDAAIMEARKITNIFVDNGQSISEDIAYYFYVDNETISGVYQPLKHKFTHKRVVCDMSSSIFAYSPNFNELGLVFAATQKHLGIPGLALVIIDNEWLDKTTSMPYTPSILNYKLQKKSDSLLNTPYNAAWLTALYMLEWMDSMGGLSTLQHKLQKKAADLYAFLDNSTFYSPLVDMHNRSISNITFKTRSAKQDSMCIDFLQKQGIIGVKGHKAIGHLRVSMYIGHDCKQLEILINALKDFEKQYG